MRIKTERHCMATVFIINFLKLLSFSSSPHNVNIFITCWYPIIDMRYDDSWKIIDVVVIASLVGILRHVIIMHVLLDELRC